MSLFIGSYVFSASAFNGDSSNVAGATIVSGLSAVVSNCRINGSSASTSTSSGESSAICLSSGFFTMNTLDIAESSSAGSNVSNWLVQ
jgi:hypothetical protein